VNQALCQRLRAAYCGMDSPTLAHPTVSDNNGRPLLALRAIAPVAAFFFAEVE
jgi:hypothetical protein